jgi:threonine synthase
MRYLSTRGGLAPTAFSDILLGGLAPDGGLTLPESYPAVTPDELAEWRDFSYPQLAFAILSRFADDIPAADLQALIDQTYTAEAFRSEAITPAHALERWRLAAGLVERPDPGVQGHRPAIARQPV